MNLRSIILPILGSLFLFSMAKGDACGGLLEADGGELEFPVGGSIEEGSVCIWVIQLLSRKTVNFSLNRLSTGSTLNLYPEHESSETVLNPIVLTNADVGNSVTTNGQTLIVILTTTEAIHPMGFSFTWDSMETTTSDLLVAASYVDTEEGRVTWNRFNSHERLTWALNLQPGKLVTIKTSTEFDRCDLIDPCQCTYFALYEVIQSGRLREVNRICGHDSSFQVDDLLPQLLTFVYINSTLPLSSDRVELQWASAADSATTTTTTTTSTEKPPTDEPPMDTTTNNGDIGVVVTCGGVVEVVTETWIEYKLDTEYVNNERCLWTIRTDVEFAHLQLTLDTQGFEGIDGLTFNQWNFADNTLTEFQVDNSNGQEFNFDTNIVFLIFTSDNVDPGVGFRMKILATNSGPSVPTFNYYSYSVDGPQGTFRHPETPGSVYQQNERTSAVFHPTVPSSMNLFLNFLAIEQSAACRYDSLDIFLMRGRFGYQKLGSSLCGLGGPEKFNVTSEFAVLALFRSDTTAFDEGFEFDWAIA